MNAELCKAGEGRKILGNKKLFRIAGQGCRKMAFQKEKAEGDCEKEAQSERRKDFCGLQKARRGSKAFIAEQMKRALFAERRNDGFYKNKVCSGMARCYEKDAIR